MRTDNINEIKEKRASLVQELRERITDSEQLKYYPVLYQCECILEELKELRKKELDILGKK